MSINANIFSVVRASLHDGPGIRTVIYFSGCNMRCQWCHNPEGFTKSPKLMFFPEKCIGCGRCIRLCPEHHVVGENGKIYIPEGCNACGKCADACPSEAIQMTARSWSMEELIHVLEKDLPYFLRSGGGITFSGGECLLQSGFVAEVSKYFHKKGIHTLMETALHVDPECLINVIPWIDLFYVDIKHMDNTLHKKFTGVENHLVLSNLRLLANTGKKIRIRTPLIPNVNDDFQNLLQTAQLAFSLQPSVIGYTLLKYNNLGISKYNRLGLTGTVFAEETQSDQPMKQLCDRLNQQLDQSEFVSFQE